MTRHGFGPAPMVMGLILGNLVEDNLSRSMIIYDNNWFRFFESPIVDLFFLLTLFPFRVNSPQREGEHEDADPGSACQSESHSP